MAVDAVHFLTAVILMTDRFMAYQVNAGVRGRSSPLCNYPRV